MKSLLLAAVAVSCIPTAVAAEASGKRFAATVGYAAQRLDGDTLVPVSATGYPIGSEVESDDGNGAATLGLSWYLTDRVALELWGATASDSGVEIDVENGADVGVASYRTRPLALSVQYHFNDLFDVLGAQVSPFVGVGYHHTEVSGVGSNAALADYAGLEIDGGGGVAASAGLDVALGGRWFVRGDVRYLRWSSTSKVGGRTLAESDINSLYYGASLGLRF